MNLKKPSRLAPLAYDPELVDGGFGIVQQRMVVLLDLVDELVTALEKIEQQLDYGQTQNALAISRTAIALYNEMK